jgi:hypothetical protein
MGASPTLIYLLRHGEVRHAETRRFIGHLDVPLSERGERQCAVQAQALRRVPLAAVFSSDLARARRSAEIIGVPHGLAPREVPALREMSMGRWDGLTPRRSGTRTRCVLRLDGARGRVPVPGGRACVCWRVAAFACIATGFASRGRGGARWNIAPSQCHALVPLERLLGFGQDYGALSLLVGPGPWQLRRLNERPML